MDHGFSVIPSTPPPSTAWPRFTKPQVTALLMSIHYKPMPGGTKSLLMAYDLQTCRRTDKVRITAISYDSNYDKGRVLKEYGNARGFDFSNDDKMFCCQKGFDKIKKSLDLGVNYKGSFVCLLYTSDAADE